MDQQIKELEEKIGKNYSNTTGIVVLKEGNCVYESYFKDCAKDHPVHIYSVTKSVISILIGIALDKGYIQSVDQKVLEFFPEYQVEQGETNIQKITLRDMLTMTAPYKYRFFAPYVRYFTSRDHVKFSLDLLGGRGKIGNFRYAPLIGPDIFSGILVKVTGRSVLEFANEVLFEPLDIHVDGSITFRSKEEQMAFNESTDISGWVMDPAGIHTAGWGLTLTAADMAKIGQLYLNGGVWKDRRIVSERWIKDSIIEHSRWRKRDLPYGYLWWVNEDGYAAVGDGGNTIYVNTRETIVIAMTALFVPNAGDRIEFIKKQIEPIFI